MFKCVLSSHHARLTLWIQQQLFTKRTTPLISKGVLRELSELNRKTEAQLNDNLTAHADAKLKYAILQTRLNVLQLAPGPENHDLAAFATNLEALLTHTRHHAWPALPKTMFVSVKAIVDAMKRDVQTDNLSIPKKSAGFSKSGEVDWILDLIDF